MKCMLNNEVASARPPSVGPNLLEEIELNMVLLLYVVKVLCYKSEGRAIEPATMVLRSTQPLTEMSTRSISWG